MFNFKRKKIMDEKVKFTKVNNANLSVTNENDSEKKYAMRAEVNVSGTAVESVNGGAVIKDGVTKAVFTQWGDSLNPTFQGVTSVAEMCEVLTAISAFIDEVKSAVAKATVTVMTEE